MLSCVIVCFAICAIKFTEAAEFEEFAENPQYLTELLRKDQAEYARLRSKVTPPDGEFGHINSFSGLITVDDASASNLFFWWFETQKPGAAVSRTPLILWLQGGPGSSSMFGLFALNGPFNVDADVNLVENKFAWTNRYNMLYVDNPVGVGFSFTKDKYVRNEDEVAEDFWQFFLQFSEIYPEVRHVPFYVAGESYAGKYVPAIGHRLQREKEAGNLPMNFQGIMVGNGISDPETQISVLPAFFYNIGQLNDEERRHWEAENRRTVKHIRAGEFKEAADVYDELFDGDFAKYPTFWYNATGCSNYMDYTYCNTGPSMGNYRAFLQLQSTREFRTDFIQIFVEFISFNQKVELYLYEDFFQTVKPEVEYLLNADVKVLYYSGMYDERVPTVGTVNFLNHLSWPEADQYRQAKKSVWKLRDSAIDPVGYVTQHSPLTFVAIREASHYVPFAQPEASLEMITNFIENKPYN